MFENVGKPSSRFLVHQEAAGLLNLPLYRRRLDNDIVKE